MRTPLLRAPERRSPLFGGLISLVVVSMIAVGCGSDEEGVVVEARTDAEGTEGS